jgi:ABC-type phosphate transport system permease subunit
MVYEEPFEVNPDEVTTLYAFADDNVANRSGVAVYDLAQDQQSIWNIWMIAGGAVVMLIVLGAFLSLKRMRHSRRRVRRRR